MAKGSTLSGFFSRAAMWVSHQSGRAPTFALAVGVIVVWAATGPLFGFSDTWQLIINTGTTIVTFLMVFLIQNTQNRDTGAIQLKLDELIRVNHQARNNLLTLEDLSDEELAKMKAAFARLASRAPATREKLRGAVEDLSEAEEDIEDARAKLTAGEEKHR